MNRKLTAGVITSLLLTAPTAITNAQENDIQPRTEQVAPIVTVAAETAKEQILARFGKLSESSTNDEMVLAKEDLIIVQNSGDFAEEQELIEAKYNYIMEQRRLLGELKTIGNSINAISHSSKSFFTDVESAAIKYSEFLGDTATEDSYLYVQNQFQQVLAAALADGKANLVATIRGTSLQYGYDETARNAYFKGKGADIDKLKKLQADAEKTQQAADELTAFVTLLENGAPIADISTAVNKVATTYNALTADQKKVIAAYNPSNAAVTPYKQYTETQANIASANKVVTSITELSNKKPEDFKTASNFISAVAAIEKAYNALDANLKNWVTNYAELEPYKQAADIAKRISALRVSSDATYRTEVNELATQYEQLSDKKSFVKNAADLNQAVVNIAAAVSIETLITNISTAPNKVDAIQQARAAYNAPPSGTAKDVKKIVNNAAELTKWEKDYKASLNVNKLIANLDPASKTFEKKTIAAKAAYDKLAAEEQLFVQEAAKLTLFFSYANALKQLGDLNPTAANYTTKLAEVKTSVASLDATGSEHKEALDAIKAQLEAEIAAFENEDVAVAAVIAQIDALSGSSKLVEDMLAARTAYDALPSSTAKKRVTNIKILTDLEKSHKAVVNVVSLFEKLDTSAKNYLSKAKSAYTAYDKLAAADQAYVKNYNGLNDVVRVTAVVVQINALNPSKKTYKDDVKAATDAYTILDVALQEQVVNYTDLTKAQGYIDTAKAFDERILALANENPDTFVTTVATLSADYKAMDKNAKKLVEQAKTLAAYEKDNKTIIKVIQMIDALDPTSKDYTKKVLAARKAYNGLDEVAQKRVTNYANLTAVEDVASLIGLISSLKPTSKTFLEDLKTARELYDALPEAKQQAIINYDALVAAENEQTTAAGVIALIELTEEQDADYLTKLMNARVAYDQLSSNQKKLVTNIKDLTTREKAVKPILKVMVQINELDPEAKNFVSKVNAARKAYDKLTKDQKKYIDNIDALLKYEPVSNVVELISKLKSSSSTFLQDTSRARSLYDALPVDMQQYVTNYYLLEAAEASILGAGNVMQMITDLPSVDPKQYVKRVQEIRAAYNALPKDQQRAVQNYKVLQEQEKLVKPVIKVVEEIDRLFTAKDMNSQYQKILKAYDKLNADQRRYVYNDQLLLSLDNVIKVYNNIAKLNPKDKFYFGMVEAVRKEYDSLNSVDKQRISNYSILLDAEKSMADVKKVVEMISALSPTSVTYIEDVANAVAAYKALDSKVRGQVINEDALKQAEKDVAAVLKVVQAIGNIDPDSSSFEKKVLDAQKKYSALSLEQQDLVYNYRILDEYLKMIQ
ncbi:cell wall-binding protein [Lysinibacillus sp. NPDC098008]|uniref:cell wall-binding protein n=1 Tax=Lysinibacillus sp. NPDC098008 TaxID=3364146 RepID=UPI00382C4800